LKQAEAAEKTIRNNSRDCRTDLSFQSSRFRRPDGNNGSERYSSTDSEKDRQNSFRFRRPDDDNGDNEQDSRHRHSAQRSDHPSGPAWRKKDDRDGERNSDQRHSGQRSERIPMRDHRSAPAWRKKDLPSNLPRDTSRVKQEHEQAISDLEHRESKISVKTTKSSMKFQDDEISKNRQCMLFS